MRTSTSLGNWELLSVPLCSCLTATIGESLIFTLCLSFPICNLEPNGPRGISYAAKLLCLLRSQRSQERAGNVTPIPFPPQTARLSSISLAEPRHPQHHAAPPRRCPPLCTLAICHHQNACEGKAGHRRLGGRLVCFDQVQTARGGSGRPAKTRRRGKWIREMKGGKRWSASKGEGAALESRWHPGGAGKGAYPYGVRATHIPRHIPAGEWLLFAFGDSSQHHFLCYHCRTGDFKAISRSRW